MSSTCSNALPFPRFTSIRVKLAVASPEGPQTPINDATPLASKIEHRALNCYTNLGSHNNGHTSLISSA